MAAMEGLQAVADRLAPGLAGGLGLLLLQLAWPRRRWMGLASAAAGLGVALLWQPGGVLSWLVVVGVLALGAALVARLRRRPRRLQAAHDALQARLVERQAELDAALAQTRSALAAAEAAGQAKTHLLAAASHDLRQPAHALGLYLAALRAGPLVPAQAELAERMAATLSGLEALFGALLDVARIDAQAVVPRWDLVALAPLLRRLADEWAPAAEARGLRLALRAGPDDAVSATDPVLLERVLRNLLANAVTHTSSGGVLLACRLRHDADGRAGWRIEVWDSGRGIAPSERERIFEAFYQGSGAARDGLGLGLTIVQRLLELLQLRLVLHSRPGRGSVFMVDGLAPAGEQPRRAAAERDRMRRLDGLHVAVIDADADVRDAMRRLLALWGCRVTAAADAPTLRQRLDGAVPQALVAESPPCGADDAGAAAALQALFAAWPPDLPVLWVRNEAAPAAAAPDGADAAEDPRLGETTLHKPVSPARLRAWLEGVAAAER
jgi:signal transduction histidine kinase/CheY-like chemotaxis protein